MPKARNPLCCLCGGPYEGIGNNPAPLASRGRCCDACNEVVILARIDPAAMVDEMDRVEQAIFRKLGVGIHQVTVAAVCAMRGPGLLAAKMRDRAMIRHELWPRLQAEEKSRTDFEPGTPEEKSNDING